MKTAIVHYWLVNMRGGEKVLESLLELFPGADIFTNVYDPASVSTLISSRRVYTSSVNRLPFAKKMYQKYMPLMPNALLEFNLQDYDLIISSESGPAKGVIPNPNAYHLCYCHSPMRYLWDMYHEYFGNSGMINRFFMRNMIPGLRLWDISSSNYVDRFVTNSNYVARRVLHTYNREAAVVFPPVTIERYLEIPRKPEDFYLFFGQLTRYKRPDLAIEACIKYGRKIVVAGSGMKESLKKKYEKSGLVSFPGKIQDEEIPALFSRARALLFPGIEDFGMIPVEANAAGCPVIAYRRGGALDTVLENKTGLFFDTQDIDSLAEAIRRFEENQNSFEDRNVYNDHVKQFSRENFKKKILDIINERKHI
ncbi:MAG: glycosyltransferase [Treponema sp.]|jgi:glycosyltransferase involved in cell wall biosynthesis|nr:glycosyltransferase [Treponema sp.]